MKFITPKKASGSPRPALHPERAWLVALSILVVSVAAFSLRGIVAYISVQAEESVVPEGAERVISKDEFLSVFARFKEKQDRFDKLLVESPQVSDPAR